MRHVRLPRPKTVATSKHRFAGGIFNGQARAAACRRLGRCPDHDQCNSRAGVRSAHESGTAGRVVGRRRPRRCPDRGVYEATLPNRRLEATITTIEGPRKLSFAWPLSKEDRSVMTTVAYELYPKGPQTAVHVTHHSPETVAGDWGAMWPQALDLLKSYLETPQPASKG